MQSLPFSVISAKYEPKAKEYTVNLMRLTVVIYKNYKWYTTGEYVQKRHYNDD